VKEILVEAKGGTVGDMGTGGGERMTIERKERSHLYLGGRGDRPGKQERKEGGKRIWRKNSTENSAVSLKW